MTGDRGGEENITIKVQLARQINCLCKFELEIPFLESDLVSICSMLLLIGIQKVSKPKVSNLDVVWRFHQNVMSSQVSVHQPPLLQVHHTLFRVKVIFHRLPGNILVLWSS